MNRQVNRALAALFLGSCAAQAIAADVTIVRSQQQGSTLVTVDSAAPATVRRSVTLSGLAVGERLIGFDARAAANRLLYGLSNTGQVYAINGVTGVATSIGTPLPLSGFPAAAGFDFNPSVDRIRIVTDANQNFRVNPDTGAIAATDPDVGYRPGDVAAGSNPNITGAAYTNNVAGGTPTVLYLIDSGRGTLVTQGSIDGAISPNSGQLLPVGNLGVATGASTAFDVSRTGAALALLTNPASNVQGVYSINLATGAATLVSVLPTGANISFTGLAFTPTPFVELSGITANTQAAATVLDRFTGVPSAGLVQIFGAFDALPGDADRATALARLTPASFALLPELTFQSINNQDNVVRGYLRDVRAGGTGRSDVATLGTDGRIGMFLVAGGRTGNLDGGIDRNRTDYGASSITGGIDYRFVRGILVGAFGGYDRARARLNDVSENSDIDSWYVGGYASASLGGFFVDAQGSYGKTDFDLRRGIGSLGGTQLAMTRSENWQGAGVAGFGIEAGAARLEPYVGMRYAQVDLGGFSETGGAAALTVAGGRIKSLQSVAGLKIAGNFPIGSTAVLRPHVRGEWRREFENDDARLIVANFGNAGISRPFGFTTTPLGRDHAAIGAGFTVSGASKLSLVIDYTGEIAGDRNIHGITGGIRLAF